MAIPLLAQDHLKTTITAIVERRLRILSEMVREMKICSISDEDGIKVEVQKGAKRVTNDQLN